MPPASSLHACLFSPRLLHHFICVHFDPPDEKDIASCFIPTLFRAIVHSHSVEGIQDFLQLPSQLSKVLDATATVLGKLASKFTRQVWKCYMIYICEFSGSTYTTRTSPALSSFFFSPSSFCYVQYA
jgi:hypothetical protein